MIIYFMILKKNNLNFTNNDESLHTWSLSYKIFFTRKIIEFTRCIYGISTF